MTKYAACVMVCLLAHVCCFGAGLAKEINFWPVWVHHSQSAAGRPTSEAFAGPIMEFSQRADVRIFSIRPLWMQWGWQDDLSGSSQHVLYPVFNAYQYQHSHHLSLLNLVRYRRDHAVDGTFFEAFPVIFYNRDATAQNNYFALWPVGGHLKNRLWRDQIDFALWPLFVRTQLGDETRWHFPYPFLRLHTGPHSSGWGIWPLYGNFEREGHYQRRWALWPVYYHTLDRLTAPQPRLRWGIWPLYHHESAQGLVAHGWLWPFFGFSREFDPRPEYAENRYLYPFWIQGRGEQRHVNRWLPLFALETQPGYSKTWALWPLFRQELWEQPVPVQHTRVLFFLFRDERQLHGDSAKRFSTLWPLFASWSAGEGRRQIQALDPISSFFPRNQKMKENFSPLFALYRFDERAGNRRHALLWNLITHESSADGDTRLQVGPLWETQRQDGQRQWRLLHGFLGSEMDDDGQRYWRLLWLRLPVDREEAAP